MPRPGMRMRRRSSEKGSLRRRLLCHEYGPGSLLPFDHARRYGRLVQRRRGSRLQPRAVALHGRRITGRTALRAGPEPGESQNCPGTAGGGTGELPAEPADGRRRGERRFGAMADSPAASRVGQPADRGAAPNCSCSTARKTTSRCLRHGSRCCRPNSMPPRTVSTRFRVLSTSTMPSVADINWCCKK